MMTMPLDNIGATCSIAHASTSKRIIDSLMHKLLEFYLMKSVRISRRSFINVDELKEIVWLQFSYCDNRFLVGRQKPWRNALGLYSLLDNLLQSKSCSDDNRIKLEGSTELSKIDSLDTAPLDGGSQTFAIEYECKSEEENFEAYFIFEPSGSGTDKTPENRSLPNLTPLQLSIELGLVIDLGPSKIAALCTLKHPEVIIDSKQIFGSSENNLRANFISNNTLQIINSEKKIPMDKNFNLNTFVRLGALEMTLEDLVRLEVGSQIKFNLPAITQVDLELGGRTIAKAELKSDGQIYTLGILESFL